MKQEVREPAIYNAIITAIATGYSRMSEISTKVGESTTTCTSYIKNLINLGIIKKETPYGEKASKKTIYSIEDNMFYFWYRFVLKNSAVIARGAADLVYKRIENNSTIIWAEFLRKSVRSIYGNNFCQEICRLNLYRLAAGGEMTLEREVRQRSILWESRIAVRQYLRNVSGEMKVLI